MLARQLLGWGLSWGLSWGPYARQGGLAELGT